MKKNSLIYLALVVGLVSLGVTTLYYKRLSTSLENEVKSMRASENRGQSQALKESEIKQRAEQAEYKEAERTQIGETEINDQDLIVQFKREVERLDRVIAGLRDELQKEKDLNVDLRMKLASPSEEKPRFKDSDKEPIGSLEDRSRPSGFFRERTENAKSERRAFFQEIETGQMTEEELQIHETLLDTVDRIEEVEDRVAGEKSPKNRRLLRRELQQNKRELTELMLTEREILLRQYARSLGYKEDQLQQFSDRVRDIVNMTDERRFPSGPPPQLQRFFSKE